MKLQWLVGVRVFSTLKYAVKVVNAKPQFKERTVRLCDVIERLQLFNSKATEICQWTFWAKATAPDAGGTIRVTPNSVTSERRGADREATAAAVLTLRFWMQPRDGIEISDIVALYNELPLDAEIIHWVNFNYGDHLAILDGRPDLDLSIDGFSITNRFILETFVYGAFAHANEDKLKAYELFQIAGYKDFADSMFENAVLQFLPYVFWLARVNEQTIETLEKLVAADRDRCIVYEVPTGQQTHSFLSSEPYA